MMENLMEWLTSLGSIFFSASYDQRSKSTDSQIAGDGIGKENSSQASIIG
jgi:hypothetical protein